MDTSKPTSILAVLSVARWWLVEWRWPGPGKHESFTSLHGMQKSMHDIAIIIILSPSLSLSLFLSLSHSLHTHIWMNIVVPHIQVIWLQYGIDHMSYSFKYVCTKIAPLSSLFVHIFSTQMQNLVGESEWDSLQTHMCHPLWRQRWVSSIWKSWKYLHC